ncbi:UDP-2,3-diacylglucosamine diphosphatase [Salinisphaera sp.]|uniref:UDP-2,3-diacylglucosamine diphosphatase n=1 Tax=Salinisphaera sp. TaxID=1914330 RepID=UPI000C513831|nr:UDP-2,3-diacylglucosamine diphosphatase [Salinisphaera sp.]MBS62822.1 UDP-2,3-diacylglucosamine diphosphatase [Salinisphaera sp.]
MAVHLLADVHLTGDDDPNAQRLIRYLDGPARAAEAVYVLGDLFDVWVGDDGSLPTHAGVIDRFAALARTGVPLYFMRGNRDFAVGEAFVAASHMQILDDPVVVDLQGTPTLLSHGDIFCTDDTAHQAFRARYTNPRWRARMMKIPLWLRRRIARRARRRSLRGKARKPAHIMDVNAEAVRESLQAHDVTRLIHGHTHRPDTHYFDIEGQACERIVLADWRPERVEVLIADSHGIDRVDVSSG